MRGLPALSPRRLALTLVWITPALWSSNYIIAKAAAGVVAPHMLALGRWLLALVLLLPFVWRHLPQMAAAWRSEWRSMLTLGALGMWVCGAFVYIGAQSTSATNIALIYAATPVGIAIAGRWLLNEAMNTRRQIAIGMSVIGVLVVIARGDPRTLLEVRFSTGDLWIITAGLSWVAYSVLQQLWRSALPASQRLACMIVGGLLFLFPGAGIESVLHAGPPLSGGALVLVGLAGLLPGFLSYQAYSIMIRELGVTHAGVVMYLSPIYAVFTAWWFLGEIPQWYHLVGALLILPSVYMVGTAGRS